MVKKKEEKADGGGRGAGLPGRRGQAARNDEVILEAARAVFVEDPKAPVSAVAARAGVGISALYRRYKGKEELLRRLCHDGLLTFAAEAERAAGDPDPWRALTGFLRRVVDADVHSLAVHLAGSFTPTEEMNRDAVRAAELGAALVVRAREAGCLRPDVVPDDVTLVLEGCAAIRLPDPERTRRLRERHLALLISGMAAAGERSEGERAAALPGPPPEGAELAWRWSR